MFQSVVSNHSLICSYDHMIVVEVEIEFNELSTVPMIYLHSHKTPGVLAFLLGTNEITLLGVVTVSDGVESMNGGLKKSTEEEWKNS